MEKEIYKQYIPNTSEPEEDWELDSWETDTNTTTIDNPELHERLERTVNETYVHFTEKPERAIDDNKKSIEIVDWSEAVLDISDPRYELMGHGTTGVDIAQKIMEEGVMVGGIGNNSDTDISSSFLYLDANNPQSMTEILNDWPHNGSEQIAILRVPVKYKLPFPQDCMRYQVYYHEDPNVEGRGYYESEYIYGYYNANTNELHKNPNYHGDLDNPQDVAYLEETHSRIVSDYLDSLPEEDKSDWLDILKMYYDFQP